MKRKRVSDLNHFQILNVHSTADNEIVGEAYLNLTSVYGDGSIATYGALDEKEREWMLKRIQEAYDTLMEPLKRKEYLSGLDDFEEVGEIQASRENSDIQKRNDLKDKASHPVEKTNGKNKGANQANSGEMASPIHPSATRITGAHLRNVRMARGASLDEIAGIIKVKRTFLEALEKDDFDAFPAPVFMRGFLKSYAKALGLNPEEISVKYFAKD